MTQMIYILLILLLISILLISLNFLIAEKSFQDREKSHPLNVDLTQFKKIAFFSEFNFF